MEKKKPPQNKQSSKKRKMVKWEIDEFPRDPVFIGENQNPKFKNHWNENRNNWSNYSLADEIINYHEKYYQYTLKLNRLYNEKFNEITLKPELYSGYYFETKGYIFDIELQINNLKKEIESLKKSKKLNKRKFEELFYTIERCEYNKDILTDYSIKIKPFVNENGNPSIKDNEVTETQFSSRHNYSTNITTKNHFIWLDSRLQLFFLFEALENLGFIYPDNVSKILKDNFIIFDRKKRKFEKLDDDSIKDYRSKVKSPKTILNPSQKMKDLLSTLRNLEVEKK